jgi:hypothetical protein
MDDQSFTPPPTQTPPIPPIPPEEIPPPEPVTPSQPVYSTYSAPKRVSTKSLLVILLGIIVIAAGVAAGYEYGHKAQKTITIQKSVVQSVNSVPNIAGNVHFVQSIGYPYDQAASKYQYVTKLGVPSFMQAVRIASTAQDQGAGETAFTNLNNNELGRWELGNPTNPSDNSGAYSEISLLAITNSWLNATGTTDYSDLGYGSPLETPTQKQQYMTQLEASTAACVKDASKGFKTADGNLSICYSIVYNPKSGETSYKPIITLSGYGDVQGQPMVLVGTINVYNSAVGTTQADQNKAVAEANAGQAPDLQIQNAIINALQQTTVTASPNPNL